MFDWVPIRAWLLLGIGLMAFPSAKYLFRYVSNAPERVDITLPAVDLSWRTTGKFAFSVVAILALSALAVFIYTPAAADFAESPSFWPILIAAAAAFMTYDVIKGLLNGETEPLVKGGSLGPYSRESQPWRFWVSMAWNAAWVGGMIWFALEMLEL